MIENILYFAFGFLIAMFLGMLMAPLLWKRAIVLTERHLTKRVNPDVKAKVAEHDHHFANLAMENQRDSIQRHELEQENAELIVEIVKHRDQIKALKMELRRYQQSAQNPDSQSVALKKQIIDMTAKFTVMTAMLEGKRSSIYRAVNAKDENGQQKNSLADKIKLLHENLR